MNAKIAWIILILILIISVIVLCVIVPDFNPTFEASPKDEIVGIFTENRESFLPLVEFARSTEGNLYVLYISWRGERIIENRGNESEIEDISPEVENSIEALSRRLKYFSVYESGDDEIYFALKSGEVEQGICFLGNNQKPSYPEDIVHIQDNWYYYTAVHE